MADGAGGVQLAFGTFGLPALDGDLQHALGEPPQGLADQLLPAADAAEQGYPGHAQFVGQALHVQPSALVDPPGGGRDDAVGQADLSGALAFWPTAFRPACQGLRGRDPTAPGSRLGFRRGGHTATITRANILVSRRGDGRGHSGERRTGGEAACGSLTPAAHYGAPARRDATSLENSVEEMA